MVQQNLSADIDVGVDPQSLARLEQLEVLLERIDLAIGAVDALPDDLASSFTQLRTDAEQLRDTLERPTAFTLDLDDAYRRLGRLESNIVDLGGAATEAADDVEMVDAVSLDSVRGEIERLSRSIQGSSSLARALSADIQDADDEDLQRLTGELDDVRRAVNRDEMALMDARRELEQFGDSNAIDVQSSKAQQLEVRIRGLNRELRNANRNLEDIGRGGIGDATDALSRLGIGNLAQSAGIQAFGLGSVFGTIVNAASRSRVGRVVGLGVGAASLAGGIITPAISSLVGGERRAEQELFRESLEYGFTPAEIEALRRQAALVPGLEAQDLQEIVGEAGREAGREAILREDIPQRLQDIAPRLQGLDQQQVQVAVETYLTQLETAGGSALASSAAVINLVGALDRQGASRDQILALVDEVAGGATEIERLIGSVNAGLFPSIQSAVGAAQAQATPELQAAFIERLRAQSERAQVGERVRQGIAQPLDRLQAGIEGAVIEAVIDPVQFESVMRDSVRDGVGEALDGRPAAPETDPFASLTTGRR